MEYNQTEPETVSYVSIVNGTIVCFISLICLTIILGSLTNFGWPGMLHWPGSGYLMLVYFSLTGGSIFAGLYSRNLGWVVGMGVGLLTSFILLISALLSGEAIKWGLFILKAFIHCFIGAFGGIIGINISKK
jgi:putative membrane protein (TIGR04086 family)